MKSLNFRTTGDLYLIQPANPIASVTPCGIIKEGDKGLMKLDCGPHSIDNKEYFSSFFFFSRELNKPEVGTIKCVAPKPNFFIGLALLKSSNINQKKIEIFFFSVYKFSDLTP